MFGAITTLIIITFIDDYKCQKYNMTKPTILDADNMDQIIHIDELDDNDNLRRVAEENVVACHNEDDEF